LARPPGEPGVGLTSTGLRAISNINRMTTGAQDPARPIYPEHGGQKRGPEVPSFRRFTAPK
jgi:hypothetical protein